LAPAGFLPPKHTDDKAHQQWLEARYKEATSIQPGMTRAELLKLFIEEGGLQLNPPRNYVFKELFPPPIIHIEGEV